MGSPCTTSLYPTRGLESDRPTTGIPVCRPIVVRFGLLYPVVPDARRQL